MLIETRRELLTAVSGVLLQLLGGLAIIFHLADGLLRLLRLARHDRRASPIMARPQRDRGNPCALGAALVGVDAAHNLARSYVLRQQAQASGANLAYARPVAPSNNWKLHVVL